MSFEIKNEKLMAKVAVDKSLLKEYKNEKNERIVYLNDGDEFQLQLVNLEQYVIGVQIALNGKSISNQKLVLKPGERVWLERYFDSHSKFKFSTYEVEDSSEIKEAIQKNGEISISFYKEQTIYYDCNKIAVASSPSTVYVNSTPISGNINVVTQANSITNLSDDVILNSDVCSCDIADYAIKTFSNTANYCQTEFGVNTISNTAANAASTTRENTIETGRIDKGSYSKQDFKTVYTDFESWPFKKETIKILPSSRKPISASDLQKIYCTECGRKLNPKYKFCPYCGAKCI